MILEIGRLSRRPSSAEPRSFCHQGEPTAGGRATEVNNIRRRRRGDESSTIALHRSGSTSATLRWINTELHEPRSRVSGPGTVLQAKEVHRQPTSFTAFAYIMAPSNEASVSHAHPTDTSNVLNSPAADTPPHSATPLAIEKRKSERKSNEENVARSERSTRPDSLDPNRLSKAIMKEFDDVGRNRDVTPGSSPSRKRQRVYGDR